MSLSVALRMPLRALHRPPARSNMCVSPVSTQSNRADQRKHCTAKASVVQSPLGAAPVPHMHTLRHKAPQARLYKTLETEDANPQPHAAFDALPAPRSMHVYVPLNRLLLHRSSTSPCPL